MVAVKEEREAWDRYAAAYMAILIHSDLSGDQRASKAAERADQLLEERRKRFPLETGPAADASAVAFGEVGK